MNVKQLDEKLFQAAMHRVRKGHDARAYAEAANDFGRSVSFFVVVCRATIRMTKRVNQDGKILAGRFSGL
jgi:hypothetical protein